MSSQTGAVEPASRSADGETPVADRIRDRIRKARGRFRANDNIAAYIEDGELDELRLEVAGGHVRYEGEGFRLAFEESDPLGTLAGEADGEVDLTYARLTALVARALLDPSALNYLSCL